MALTRKFNGKLYHFDIQFHNEFRAQVWADRIRREGGLAQCVKVDSMTWEVWKR